jgi:cellulase/cellobiase CelA1
VRRFDDAMKLLLAPILLAVVAPAASASGPPRKRARRGSAPNLWIKTPGESDGECRGGAPAGRWFPERAADLIATANPPL